jgi:hypothetical protein
MEQPEQKQADVHVRRWIMEERHYKTVSQWLERLGLIVAASLVIQKIVAGASFGDPVVIFGVSLTIIIYVAAFDLLLRS